MNMATKHEILQAHLGDWPKAKGNERNEVDSLVYWSKLPSSTPSQSAETCAPSNCVAVTVQSRNEVAPGTATKRPAAIGELWESMERPGAEAMHPENEVGKLRSISLGTLKEQVVHYEQKQVRLVYIAISYRRTDL